MTASTTKTHVLPGETSSTGGFLCVCGELIRVTSSPVLTCSHCGRQYSHEAVSRYGAETRTIHSGKPTSPPEPPEERPAVQAEKSIDTLPVGSRLGHFEIVGVIGRGGVGMVYKALDTSLNRFVALKVIRAHTNPGKRQEFVDRLFDEARAQARINHPNVVHVYYVGREGEIPYLAMELINGPTLSRQVHAKALPFDRVIRYAIQVTDALEHAARFDIVHGDVKPSNMLVTPEEKIKLSDFGQASRVSDATGKQGVIAGTPNYIPPEADYGKPLGIPGDMYMLGVSCFEMTFGRLPYTFPSTDFRAKLQTHRTAAPEFPEPWPAEIPFRWRKVLARLLAKTPAERYPDYPSLMAELAQLQPSAQPPASLLARGVAWLIDLTIFGAMQAVIWLFLNSQADRTLPQNHWVEALTLAANFFPPLFSCLLQAVWGTSVGKNLLNLRIVDQYGQPLSRWRLGLRMQIQLIPLWMFAAVQILNFIWVDGLNPWIPFAAVWVVAADILTALLSSNRRSLHDILFHTRVVYDFHEFQFQRDRS